MEKEHFSDVNGVAGDSVKKKVFGTIAKVDLWHMYRELSVMEHVEKKSGDQGQFIRFVVQHIYRGADGKILRGKKLFVFDHRPEVFRAVTLASLKVKFDMNLSPADKMRAVLAETQEIVQGSDVAVVSVISKTMPEMDRDNLYFYINLFPVMPEDSERMKSKDSVLSLLTGFRFSSPFTYGEEYNPLWEWSSDIRGRTSCGSSVVTITDKNRKSLFRVFDPSCAEDIGAFLRMPRFDLSMGDHLCLKVSDDVISAIENNAPDKGKE